MYAKKYLKNNVIHIPSVAKRRKAIPLYVENDSPAFPFGHGVPPAINRRVYTLLIFTCIMSLSVMFTMLNVLHLCALFEFICFFF